MITIKLPYKASDKFQQRLKELRRQQSIVVRFAFNRYKEEVKQKDIRAKCKELKNIDSLGSWLEQCGIMEACQLYNRFKKEPDIIFGGKYNFKQLAKSKITKEEFKQKRLFPLNCQGEKNYSGNRFFKLRIIDGNFIEFNSGRGKNKERYILQLPKLKSNYRNLLFKLEELANNKEATYSVKLTETDICISFEEPILEKSNSIETRTLGIDLNPDNIGISISEWVNEKQIVIETKYFDLSEITEKVLSLNASSSSTIAKHLNNKLISETFEISKAIANLAKHYHCQYVVIEDLKFKAKVQNKRNHVGNRKCKNLWKRDKFIQNLTKRLILNNIELIKIHPAYTSLIGNLQYSYPDSVNASIEIARRGYESKVQKNKDKFYPSMELKQQWKQMVDSSHSWKEVALKIKNSKMQYRVQLIDVKSKSCLRMNSKKSKIDIYNFDCDICRNL